MSLWKIFYNLAFLVFGTFYFPFFILRLRQEKDKKRLLLQRLGFFSADFLKGLRGKRVIWIHAVSVGEVFAARPLIDALPDELQDWTLAVSTVTPTGQAIARKLFPKIPVFYFPFDLSWVVRRTISKISPSMIVLMETEIWPNLILAAYEKGIPVGVVNGRLSPRSYEGYKQVRALLRGILSKIAFFLVQFQWDSDRLQEIGVSASAIQITGNMKFDINPDVSEQEVKHLREKFFPLGKEKILLGGSTHEGEEKILINVFRKLRFEFPDLKLVLAPRHLPRTTKLVQQVEKKHFRCRLASLNQSVDDVLILDSMGELKKWYALADIIFVGGSLVKHGGQNPIEAAIFKKSIFFGPHIFNFQMVYDAFLQGRGGFQVYNEVELYEFVRRVLLEPGFGKQAGLRAFELVSKWQGATRKNVRFIKRFIEEAQEASPNREVSLAR